MSQSMSPTYSKTSFQEFALSKYLRNIAWAELLLQIIFLVAAIVAGNALPIVSLVVGPLAAIYLFQRKVVRGKVRRLETAHSERYDEDRRSQQELRSLQKWIQTPAGERVEELLTGEYRQLNPNGNTDVLRPTFDGPEKQTNQLVITYYQKAKRLVEAMQEVSNAEKMQAKERLQSFASTMAEKIATSVATSHSVALSLAMSDTYNV